MQIINQPIKNAIKEAVGQGFFYCGFVKKSTGTFREGIFRFDVKQYKSIVDGEINLPSDFDKFSWWNPADWGGNYDLNIDQYNQRKSLENESQNRIYIYIASGLLALFLLKR